MVIDPFMELHFTPDSWTRAYCLEEDRLPPRVKPAVKTRFRFKSLFGSAEAHRSGTFVNNAHPYWYGGSSLSVVVYCRRPGLAIWDRWRYSAADEDLQATCLRGWLL